MIKNGFKHTSDYKYVIDNNALLNLCKTNKVSDFIPLQQIKYLNHFIRKPNSATTKRLTSKT